MITREEIRELAQFHISGEDGWALSFYFEPRTPQNKSHREETILAKDLVRKALREAEKSSRNGSTRADLNRIPRSGLANLLVEQIFKCSSLPLVRRRVKVSQIITDCIQCS